MAIIQELENRGFQRSELRIISRCWQLNIDPPIIAKILGQGLTVDDVERVIAYLIAKDEYDKQYEIDLIEHGKFMDELLTQRLLLRPTP